MDIIRKYFPHLNREQEERFALLMPLYFDLNSRVNVISRKDIENLYERHVLHSLGVAKIFNFKNGTTILDAGTGGGFPGIPLAIFFPEVHFHLIDSIRKKIGVVDHVVGALALKNVSTEIIRLEQVNQRFDFMISRAVATIPQMINWSKGKIRPDGFNDQPNGIIYLKGGDFKEELTGLKNRNSIYDYSRFFEESFFSTKKIVHIPEASCT
jgi:16S rRNA (guanine527-N7)-methyltransferase